jgi:hypothetical protein
MRRSRISNSNKLSKDICKVGSMIYGEDGRMERSKTEGALWYI